MDHFSFPSLSGRGLGRVHCLSATRTQVATNHFAPTTFRKSPYEISLQFHPLAPGNCHALHRPDHKIPSRSTPLARLPEVRSETNDRHYDCQLGGHHHRV